VSGLRHRLVTEQDGTENVGGLVLAQDEIGEAIEIEVRMHQLSGWTVRRYGHTVRLQKGDTVRWIWVRSREPMEDTL
jgi:hypothetical protein